MAAKRRKRFTAGEIGAVNYVSAGSPAAMDFGLVGDVRCEACGAKISHVYVTDVGPLGGDCLATITGDTSTRAAVRGLVTKLRHVPWRDLREFRVERKSTPGAGWHVCASARWTESDRYYVIWCGVLDPYVTASIVRDRLDAWTDSNRWSRRPVEVIA